MTVQKTSGGLDFEALRRAIENLDADLLVSLYADDSEMRTVNRYTTPRACYGPAPRIAVAWWRKRQAKATKCSPATVAGSLS
jgi:hypothetical protein